MTRATLRQLAASGGPLLGGWCSIPSPYTAELLGAAGFDWVGIDAQHGLIGYESMLAMLQALTGTGVPAVVRVAHNSAAEIGRALDAGAAGVIVPLVNSPAEAAAAAAACRYPDRGSRSYGPVRSAFGADPQHVNEEVFCAVMVETADAVAVVEQIAAVPGVDAIFVGPNDLAVSNGLRPDTSASQPAHRAQVDRILRAGLEAGVVPGIYCGSARVSLQWLAAGFRMLAVQSDAGLLREAARTTLQQMREQPVGEPR